jgi:hypothetical protein
MLPSTTARADSPPAFVESPNWRGTPALTKLIGLLLIAGGYSILVVDVPYLDGVMWSVTSSEGLHLSDVIAAAAVVAGIAALWLAPARQ